MESVESKGAKDLVDCGRQNKHKIKVINRFHVTLMLMAGALPQRLHLAIEVLSRFVSTSINLVFDWVHD